MACLFVCYRLAVSPRGIRFISCNLTEPGQISDQSLEFLGIRAFPIRYREMRDYPYFNVHYDVEFEIIFLVGFALYSDVKPFAARLQTKNRAIHNDIHASRYNAMPR